MNPYNINSFFYETTHSIKKYTEVAKINFKSQIIWRFDVALNMLFTIAKILLAYILWNAIFGQNKLVSGFTFHSMLSYYIINSFLSGIDMSRKTSEEICNRVKLGTFSKYMVIPANVQSYFFAQNIGITAFHIFFNFIASVVWVFIFRINFTFTQSISNIVIAIAMLIMGLIFMTQLHFFIGIMSFKFLEIGFFRMIVDNIVEFITGTLIPLALLPTAILSTMKWFPFYYVSYLPSMILIGRNGDEAVLGLIVISLWVLFFFILNRFAYKKMRTLFDGVGI